MPIPTKARLLRESPASGKRPRLGLSAVAAGGAAYALTELLAGVLGGNFFAWGRAEALLFLALRPWLLLVLVFAASGFSWKDRLRLYGVALGLAALSETLLLYGLGAGNPLPEAARGLGGGLFLVLVLDLAFATASRLLVRWGRVAAVISALVLFLSPGLRPYEAMVMPLSDVRPVSGKKPALTINSALPLAWGELGPLHSLARPSEAYRVLEHEFAIRSPDVLDVAALAGSKLLLLAQPRGLAPSELVAIDDWIRRGGKALILTDPMLLWPSELPLGDIRRAPPVGLLGPLLAHWGLRLEPPPDAKARLVSLSPKEQSRRLVVFAPGSLVSQSAACVTSQQGLIADCRLGSGRAVVLADADLLHDRLWVGTTGTGTERHTRIADNPLVVADFLDLLAGLDRERVSGNVIWLDPDTNRTFPMLLALLPLLVAATPGLVSLIRSRR